MAIPTENKKDNVAHDLVLKSIISALTGKLPELKIISDSFSAVHFSYKGVPALRIIIMKDVGSTVRYIEFISENNDNAKELIAFIKNGGLKQNVGGDFSLYVDLKLSFMSFTERESAELFTLADLYKDIEKPATAKEQEEMKINKANLDLPVPRES